MTWIADILLARTRWTQSKQPARTWETVEFDPADFALTDDPANKRLVVTTGVGSRVLAGTSPIRINGGASATLGANVTVSILPASEATAGSMSSAHYSLVNGATDAATASRLVQRDAQGGASFAALVATALTFAGSGGAVYLRPLELTTTNATPTALCSVPFADDALATSFIILIAETPGVGVYNLYSVGGVNVCTAGVLAAPSGSVSTAQTSTYGGPPDPTVSLTYAANVLSLNAVGIAATTIKWSGFAVFVTRTTV